MSSEQLAEWEAYDRIEPIDRETRQDLRFASLMSLIENNLRALYGKKGCKMTSPQDFMPKLNDDKPKQQSVDDMKRILQMIAKGANNG